MKKTRFGQETVSLHCGVLITLGILIIPKVIREEMVMGHHSKRNILGKMVNVWQTAEVSDTGMAERNFCYINSMKI